jgi:hypothetical protein
MSTVQVYVVYDGDPDGPIDRMARAVADGASSVDGVTVLLHTAQQFRVEDMVAADAIILGPTEDDLAQAHALGRRVAHYALWLARGRQGEQDEIEGGVFYRQRRGHLVTR